MSFHTASDGLIPLSEKTAPASPADVFFAGVERATMRFGQFEIHAHLKAEVARAGEAK